MAYKDLREFIATLQSHGELAVVSQEVNPMYEIGAWLRHSYDQKPQGPALLFENLKGFSQDYRVYSGGVGSFRRIAMALQIDPNINSLDLIRAFKDRIAEPIKPVMVDDGPVLENVHLGDEINLYEFPVPWWDYRDGGPFIGTWHGVVSKDPSTGVRNVGMYRVQLHDRNILTVGFLPGKQMMSHFSQQRAKGEPLEVAIIIGADETVAISAATGLPLGVDEYDIAGGLRQQPVELIKCRTVDLEVPANAEIVIEGRLFTDKEHRLMEGPFGEYLGYHSGSLRMRPMMEVTAVLHRNRPILRGSLGGKPLTEWSFSACISRSAAGMHLFESQGPQGVKAVYSYPMAGGSIADVIQMTPQYVGHSWEVGRKWLTSQAGCLGKIVVIVDDDIDILNAEQVFWAMTSRMQGSRDIEVLRFCKTSRSDPSVPKGRGEFTDRVIMDATKKLDYPYVKAYGGTWPPVAVPPKQLMDMVGIKWAKEFGGEADASQLKLKETEIAQLHVKWDQWRQENYQLTPEQRELELNLSYPEPASQKEL